MSDTEVFTASAEAPPKDRLASYLGALGRGPGRSRPLTEDEAADALAIVLAGEADPMQVGALLLLMRYRGESAPELAGLVRATRTHVGAPPVGAGGLDLDWPSYAAGRSRGAPWFMLSALLLARSGRRIALHGQTSAFLKGTGAEAGARALGIPVADTVARAEAAIAAQGIVYIPLERLAPRLNELLNLRSVLGLRSPLNSAVRLLNPLGAAASLVGVFHPTYRDLHRDTATLLGWRHLAVLKGGGGEAEVNPFKPTTLHRLRAGESLDTDLPPSIAETRGERTVKGTLDDLLALWRGDAEDPAAAATVIGTAAGALLTLGADDPQAALAEARRLWAARRADPPAAVS